jgi:hypothetical protein
MLPANAQQQHRRQSINNKLSTPASRNATA